MRRGRMEDRAVRGVTWTLLDYGVNKVLTLATTLVLASLLAPADFGVIALAGVFTNALSLLGELGLANTIVLRQDLSRRAQGTVLTLMTALGFPLFALTILLAPLAGDLLGDARLADVLPLLGISVALVGPTSFYEKLLQRELWFRRRLVSRMAQNVSYALAAVALAAAGAGVWSLAVGLTLGSAVYCVVLLALAPYRVRPAFDLPVARDAVSTGKGFLLQGTLNFAQENADYLTVGPLLGARALGHYSMAYRLADLPYQAVSDPVARVTFPSFARMRSRGEDITRSFLSVFRLVALVTLPLGILLSACAEPFTRAILGDDWLPMTGALAVLGVYAALRPLQNTVAWLLNSLGLQLAMGFSTAALLVPAVPALIAAASVGGIEAVAGVVAARTAVSLGAVTAIAARRGSLSPRRLWSAARPAVLACPGTWLAAWLTAQATATALPAGLALAASAAAGLLVYACLIWLGDRGALRDGALQIARVVGRRPSMGAA